MLLLNWEEPKFRTLSQRTLSKTFFLEDMALILREAVSYCLAVCELSAGPRSIQSNGSFFVERAATANVFRWTVGILPPLDPPAI